MLAGLLRQVRPTLAGGYGSRVCMLVFFFFFGWGGGDNRSNCFVQYSLLVSIFFIGNWCPTGLQHIQGKQISFQNYSNQKLLILTSSFSTVYEFSSGNSNRVSSLY